MSVKSSAQTPFGALEIKSGSVTLPIIRLFSADLTAIAMQLREKLQQAPEFFRNAPVLLDLGGLDSDRERIDFPALAEILREQELVPVGVRGGNQLQHHAAQAAKLAVLADLKQEAAADAAPKSAAPAPRIQNTSRLIEQPVRSGQRIYAAGGDLVVLAQVSPGAEIMADGNIHIYGSLRGRALAGVQGNLDARIFCSELQAELIAIGGHYKVSENLDDAVRGKPVQIHLRENSLIIDVL